MDNKIFSGLEKFGFNNIDNINLYDDITDKETSKKEEKNPVLKLLYDKEVTCPVCNTTFKVKAVKTSAYKMESKDSDFFIRYALINPYFYDVWLCNNCGYASMKSDFSKTKGSKIQLVKQHITPKWHSRTYPDVYTISIAIERYKLSLLNFYITQAKSSKKAMNCLKLAWMYRLKEDTKNELLFLAESLKGFDDAFYKESFPIYGMERYTVMYLIGELNRRIGNNEDALLWFSKVITKPGVRSKIKELARDQRDIIKIKEMKENKQKENKQKESNSKNDKKRNFFHKFFK